MDTKALLFFCVVSVLTHSVRAQNATRPETEVNLQLASADAPSEAEADAHARIALPALARWSPRLSLMIEPAAVVEAGEASRSVEPKRPLHHADGVSTSIRVGAGTGLGSFNRLQATVAPVQANISPQHRSLPPIEDGHSASGAHAPGMWDVFTSFLSARHIDPAPTVAQQNRAILVAFRAAF